jgi:hypothetical protein
VIRVIPLETGGDARVRNEGAPIAAVLLNGGAAKALPGTWSATSELLAVELAPRFPDITFSEVRYRIKSWNELPSCIADATAALDLVACPSLLIGFSMGGAVSIGVAGHDCVTGVVALAPWIPERLSLDGLRGRRLDVIHGSWDRYLPGIPGVSATSSLRGFERARALGIEGTYSLIPRALHGAALRKPSGAILHLPRWRDWVDLVGARLASFQSLAGPVTRAVH